MSFQDLPNELFLGIVEYLGLEDRYSLLFTNRRYSQIVSGDILDFAITPYNLSLNKLQTNTLHRHEKSVTTARCACAYALTALHLGAIHGNRDTVKFILEKTSSIKITVADDIILQTPISKDKLNSTSEFLLATGVAVKAHCGGCGNTALHNAAVHGHEVMVKRLLSYGVNDCKNLQGHKALHHAAAKGHVDIVRQLVSNGGSEEDRTHSGNTALHHAAHNNHLSVIKALLDEFRWDVNIQGCNLETALHIAVNIGNRSLAKFLLQRGADNTVQNSERMLAVEVAYDMQDSEAVELVEMVALIESFAINKKCPEGETPLHRAVRYTNLVMVRRLLNSGAQIDVQDKRGYTPLHWAAAAHSEEIIFELLKRGADDSLKDLQGLRAIDIAKNNADCVYGVFFGLGRE